ncbi:MAG: VOC family protein, partial [bacterium]
MVREGVESGVLRWPIWIGAVVGDLGRQHRFWSSLLAFPEAASGPDFVRLDAGDGRSFELIEVSDQPEYNEPRFQVAFAVDDVEHAYDELRNQGVESITDVVQSGDSPWAYFRDPEGRVFAIKGQPGGDPDVRHSKGLSDAAPRLLEWPDMGRGRSGKPRDPAAVLGRSPRPAGGGSRFGLRPLRP